MAGDSGGGRAFLVLDGDDSGGCTLWCLMAMMVVVVCFSW